MHRAALALGLLVLASPALAQDQPAADGRYALQPVPDGVARLDTRTGAVSICTRQDAGWACRAAADDRRALSDELARLERENAELRRRLASAGPRTGEDRPLFQRPSERDLDEAFGLMESLMDRTRRMIERWRDERGRPTPNRT